MINKVGLLLVLMAVNISLASAQAAPQMPTITEIATPVLPDAIPLYAAPKGASTAEQWETLFGQRIVRNVVQSTLTTGSARSFEGDRGCSNRCSRRGFFDAVNRQRRL
jgi:hypothetical protein